MSISNFVNVDLRSNVHGWNLNPTAHNGLLVGADLVAESLIDYVVTRVAKNVINSIADWQGVDRLDYDNVEMKDFTFYAVSINEDGRKVGRELSLSKWGIILKLGPWLVSSIACSAFRLRNFSKRIGLIRNAEFSFKQLMKLSAVTCLTTGLLRGAARVVAAGVELGCPEWIKKHRVTLAITDHVVPLWDYVPNAVFGGMALRMEATTGLLGFLMDDLGRLAIINSAVFPIQGNRPNPNSFVTEKELEAEAKRTAEAALRDLFALRK